MYLFNGLSTDENCTTTLIYMNENFSIEIKLFTEESPINIHCVCM